MTTTLTGPRHEARPDASTAAGRAFLPQPLRVFFLVSAGLWSACLLCLSYWRFIAHRGFPYNSIFMPAPFARDLWCYQTQFDVLHSTAFFRPLPIEMFPYPPGTAIAFALFCNLLPHFHSLPYLLTTLAAVSVLVVFFVRGLRVAGVDSARASLFVAVCAVLTYPFWFVWVTGNIEIVLYLVLASAVLCFLRGRFTAAAILIGFCASMKLYPFIMLALLISYKRYKESAIAVIAFLAFSVAGLWLECPDLHVAVHGTLSALAVNRHDYMQMYMYPQSMADHSLSGFVKTAGYIARKQQVFAAGWLTAYTAVMALTGLALYFFRIRFLPLLNQIACLYLCLLLLVPESFEYTLVHLTVVFALLTIVMWRRAIEGVPVRPMVPAFVCFAFVLSVSNELVFRLHGVWGQAQCLVLVALLVMALRQRWSGLEREPWVSPVLRSPVLRSPVLRSPSAA